MEGRATVQYTRTSRAAVSHAGWPHVDTPHRQPPASTATAATTTTALLPSHRIDWIESDGNHAPILAPMDCGVSGSPSGP